jgi:hypothetical protein
MSRDTGLPHDNDIDCANLLSATCEGNEMYLRTYQSLALSLAVTVACSAAAVVRGQEPATTPPAQTTFASENLNADDPNLAARLAEVEKALKKLDDKAKADKEKAASAMSITPAGRIQVDPAAFTQNGNYLKTTEANGIEFRRLYLSLKGGGFDVVEYKV